MGKRGISPLVATVILIAFAVSLGAVVMNLGTSVAPNALSQECAGVKLQFHDLGGPQVKFQGEGEQGFVEFVVDNVGAESVAALRVSVIASKEGATKTYSPADLEGIELQPGAPLSKRVAYDYSMHGQPRQITVVPVNLRNGKKVVCSTGSATHTL